MEREEIGESTKKRQRAPCEKVERWGKGELNELVEMREKNFREIGMREIGMRENKMMRNRREGRKEIEKKEEKGYM